MCWHRVRCAEMLHPFIPHSTQRLLMDNGSPATADNALVEDMSHTDKKLMTATKSASTKRQRRLTTGGSGDTAVLAVPPPARSSLKKQAATVTRRQGRQSLQHGGDGSKTTPSIGNFFAKIPAGALSALDAGTRTSALEVVQEKTDAVPIAGIDAKVDSVNDAAADAEVARVTIHSDDNDDKENVAHADDKENTANSVESVTVTANTTNATVIDKESIGTVFYNADASCANATALHRRSWHRTVSPVPRPSIKSAALSADTISNATLPADYQLVYDTFEALESVYVLFKSRGQEQDVIFHKIQQSVSNMTKRYGG